MINIYTIGFTKKDAKHFFNIIKEEGITLIIDVRLNNTSQLAGFSKYPDIVYFLEKCSGCAYISDKRFAPLESTLILYKTKKISWEEYVSQFNSTMKDRNIEKYIKEKYENVIEKEKICFLCSEEMPEHCHRSLIANLFSKLFNTNIIHLK